MQSNLSLADSAKLASSKFLGMQDFYGALTPLLDNRSDEDEGGSLGNRSSARSSPEPPRRQASVADSRASSVVDPVREALEYREDEDHNAPADEEKEETVASLLLPQYSVRRKREHWIAKLPNFLEINPDAYDEHLWDPQEAETSGQGRIVDAGLRSLMKTNNTIRWRRSDEEGPGGSKVSW